MDRVASPVAVVVVAASSRVAVKAGSVGADEGGN